MGARDCSPNLRMSVRSRSLHLRTARVRRERRAVALDRHRRERLEALQQETLHCTARLLRPLG